MNKIDHKTKITCLNNCIKWEINIKNKNNNQIPHVLHSNYIDNSLSIQNNLKFIDNITDISNEFIMNIIQDYNDSIINEDKQIKLPLSKSFFNGNNSFKFIFESETDFLHEIDLSNRPIEETELEISVNVSILILNNIIINTK